MTADNISMEQLLAQEQTAYDNVESFLRAAQSTTDIVTAFANYRHACEHLVFADFTLAEKKEGRLWNMHTEGKRYFSSLLRKLRKTGGDKLVETRILVADYVKFLKSSQRFYREHVYRLNVAFGGIPELQAVAQKIKAAGAGGSPSVAVSDELRRAVLHSCHHALICLGDLARYRASEKLDQEPEFGPAIGYYSLACTLRPSSGTGHHQQAVVALEQRNHLRSVYHLYRSMVVAEPHPFGKKNLKLEFEKTNAAWDKGELIKKGSPNDPEAPKNVLVGWFVRLHSMCFRGEPFRTQDELEREIMGQLAQELKQRPLGSTLSRMVLVNIAAQYNSMENYKVEQSSQNEFAFYSFLRLNLKTFTTLLGLFHQDLDRIARDPDRVEAELSAKLLPTTLRILPALHMYSSWLLLNSHIVLGLANDESLASSVIDFWKTYAQTVDLVAADFPIWDLEDSSEVTYMLEEDVGVLGFEPLMDRDTGKTNQLWINKQTGVLKPRFSDVDVEQLSDEEEMLGRVKTFLEDGLYFATNYDGSPITLRGTRVLFGSDEPNALPTPPVVQKPAPKQERNTSQATSKPKILSYAAAAANGNGKPRAPKPITIANGASPDLTTASTARAHQAKDIEMIRMVDDLLDEDDGNNPVTPPQHYVVSPSVVPTNGEINLSSLQDGSTDLMAAPGYGYGAKAPISKPGYQPKAKVHGHAQSISSMWSASPAGYNMNSPKFPPPGLPITLSSPAPVFGHSRVGSANSIHSRTSQNVADSWSSLESAPRGNAPGPLMNGAFDQPAGNRPAPSGVRDSLWSTGPRRSFGAGSPPHYAG